MRARMLHLCTLIFQYDIHKMLSKFNIILNAPLTYSLLGNGGFPELMHHSWTKDQNVPWDSKHASEHYPKGFLKVKFELLLFLHI